MSLKRSSAALVIALLTLCSGIVQAADNYRVDPVHSTTAFKIKHFNISWFYGRINAPEGNIVVDNDPAKTEFDVQLKAANIDTGVQKRDDHLKSPDFFSATEFPTLSFKSTSVKAAG